MKFYKVVIEAMFVQLPGQKGLFGFFSTKYVTAINARQAVERSCGLVSKEMAQPELGESRSTRGVEFVIKDIWEIEERVFRANQTASGATFFSMSPFSILVAKVRVLWLKLVRPYLVDDAAG